MTLRQIFNAGRVMRWHTNPELAHTNDRIDGHAGRVGRIILALHPSPSVALLRSALIHDDGEIAVGDMKAPLKDKFPDIAAALSDVEADHRIKLWGHDPSMTIDDALWLRFADRLDAYMWAAVHHADLSEDGWPDAYQWLIGASRRLGCEPALKRWGAGE